MKSFYEKLSDTQAMILFLFFYLLACIIGSLPFAFGYMRPY
jgi:hypothetical protein